jgi:hypothetical protein
MVVHIKEVMNFLGYLIMIRQHWVLGHLVVTSHHVLIRWEDFHQGAVTQEIHTRPQDMKLMGTVTNIYLRMKIG